MSKRNITHKRGKQLYLNQMFLKGMLYTSSEMQEGYAKVIDNYDIAPTGDAASPRPPFKVPDASIDLGTQYTYPVKFKQLENAQAYVRFKKTISENEFVNDTVIPVTTNPGKTIDVVYRNDNAFNESGLSFNTKDYTIMEISSDTPPTDDTEDVLSKSDNAAIVEFNPDNEAQFVIKENTKVTKRTTPNSDVPVGYTSDEIKESIRLTDTFNIDSNIIYHSDVCNEFLNNKDLIESISLNLEFNMPKRIYWQNLIPDNGNASYFGDSTITYRNYDFYKTVEHMRTWGYVPLSNRREEGTALEPFNNNITHLRNYTSSTYPNTSIKLYLKKLKGYDTINEVEIADINLEISIYVTDTFVECDHYSGFDITNLSDYKSKYNATRYDIDFYTFLKYLDDDVDNITIQESTSGRTFTTKKYVTAIGKIIGGISEGGTIYNPGKSMVYDEAFAKLNRTGEPWSGKYIIGNHVHYKIKSTDGYYYTYPNIDDSAISTDYHDPDIEDCDMIRVSINGSDFNSINLCFNEYMNTPSLDSLSGDSVYSVGLLLFSNGLHLEKFYEDKITIDIHTKTGNHYKSIKDCIVNEYSLAIPSRIGSDYGGGSNVEDILNEKLEEAKQELNKELNNQISTNNLIPHTSIDKYEFIDGDTFHIKNDDNTEDKYRLWIADSVEEGYKWYDYSKYVLQELFKNTASDKSYLKFNQVGTSYDRKVVDIQLFYNPKINLVTPTEIVDFSYNFNLDNPNLTKNNFIYQIPHQFRLSSSSDGYTGFIEFNLSGICPENTPYVSIKDLNTTSLDYYPFYEYYYPDAYYEAQYDHYSLLKFFLASGLYSIRAGVDIPDDLRSKCNKYLQHAIHWRLHRWWHDRDEPEVSKLNIFTDPYYSTQDFVIQYDDKDTTLQITNDMYIEAVVLQNEYSISALTQTSLDHLNAIYIDYLDAVGFIGRIIDSTKELDNIVYKGLILLKANQSDSGATYFTILLPSNQGEGEAPSVIDAASSGYNLYNTEMLHVKNSTEPYNPFSIKGIAILNTTRDDSGNVTTNYDTPEIVTQGILGYPITLNAVLNEGYIIDSGLHNTDIWGYNLTVDFNNISYKDNAGNVLINHVHYATYITKSNNNTSSNVKHSVNLLGLIGSDITPSSIEIGSITIRHLELISPDNQIIAIPLTEKGDLSINTSEGSTIKTLLSNAFNDGLFELKLKTNISPLKTEVLFTVYDNFNSPSKTLVEVSNNVNIVDREEIPSLTKEYYAQWSVADYDSNNFIPITQEFLLYTRNMNSSKLIKVENVSEDCLWTINRSADYVTIKFSIQPKVRIATVEEHPLYNFFIKNSFEELYQVYPKFSIGNDIRIVTTKDITKNINIKNATRLDIFNRQIVLYGNNIKSNILQFSKFEKYDSYPFPFNTIELPESITHVVNYKDSLIIFGKTSIFMLSGSASVQECTLQKIYENLSCRLPDIKLIKPIGNNLMFFNNGVGYIIVPNTYVDNSSNIKIYKLTEHISNFFYNPEEYVRARLEDKNIPITDTPSYKIKFDSYIENNTINIVANIDVFVPSLEKHYYLATIFIYNQDYRYWRMYSTDIFDEIISNYICEPNLNTQFIIKKDSEYVLGYIENNSQIYKDSYRGSLLEGTVKDIQTMIHSGYLSVDTMNDKRFKDIIIEFDKINSSNSLKINFEFFVDSSPIILSSENILVIDKLTNSISDLNVDNEFTEYKSYGVHHISEAPVEGVSNNQSYGTLFEISNEKFSITGRIHVRIPVFGKGRLPSFILKIKAPKFYEFINYALIYKEKNINRRS